LRFTVRRPASAEVSPCCHRPSGGDVACSVDVGVARPRIAGVTLESRLALAVPGSDVPARGASLRRVRGRDLLDPTVSLVLQTRGKQTPSASSDATVEPALLRDPLARLLDAAPRAAGHRIDIEGLDPDRVEAPRDVSGGLFDPVLTPISLTRIDAGDRQLRASSPREPHCARASRCCNTFNRVASPRLRSGACSSSPVDNAADTTTPRSIPTTLPSPGPAIGSGTYANAICQRPARSRVTR
jgi:hypothetical protein